MTAVAAQAVHLQAACRMSTRAAPRRPAAAVTALPGPCAVLPRAPRLARLRAATYSSSAQRQRRQRLAPLAASSPDGSEAVPPPQPLALSSSDEAPALSSSSAGSGSDGEGAASSGDGSVQIDLELPRRSLLVQFTCNKCGGRSERLVNPVAWNKGMVIAQCQHCSAWHKLADAANLVQEIRYADLEDE